LVTYLLARHWLTDDLTQARSATAATVVVSGLAIVFALENQPGMRRLVVGALCVAMALLFFGACAIPVARDFFEIATPTGGMIEAWLIGSAVAIVLLAVALRVVAALDRRAGAPTACPSPRVHSGRSRPAQPHTRPGWVPLTHGGSAGSPAHPCDEDPDP